MPPIIGRILVLKLDHLGDFVIGIPALRALRLLFPAAHIRFICGRWNRANARECGLVDEVRTFDLYPEHAAGWDGRPTQDMSVFQAAVAGQFDLAIDLRVDDDTRHLLQQVDATIRCGIGSQLRWPFLDIALPVQHDARASTADARLGMQFIAPDRFESRLPTRTPLYYASSLTFTRKYLVYGPYLRLPPGRFTIAFDVRVVGLIPSPRSHMTVDVCRDDGQVVATKRFSRFAMARMDLATTALEFSNDDAQAVYEFRIFAGHRPLRGQIRFSGVRLFQTGSATSARFRPSELHVGELLSLLVELIGQRTTELYPSGPSAVTVERPGTLTALPRDARRIVIAPFSNASIKDWSVVAYATLIDLLIAQMNCDVILIGSKSQQIASEQLVTHCSENQRLINLTGKTQWSELDAILLDANLVICNDSGVAHQAARLGVATLVISSGSHQPQEWGPRGRRVRSIMGDVPCSPCSFGQLAQCTNDHLCMRLITPAAVVAHAAELLSEVAPQQRR